MRARDQFPAWVDDPPTDLESIVLILEEYAEEINDEGPFGEALLQLFKAAKAFHSKTLEEVQEAHPLAFWKPSYEQALLLNAWIWGINFPLCFAANRIGKTTAFVVNALLWIFPNNPQWAMFKPHTDEWGRKVQVHARPDLKVVLQIQEFFKNASTLTPDPYKQYYEPPNLSIWQELQRCNSEFYQPSYPYCPIRTGGQVWLGAPDNDFHKHIVMPKWRQLLPKSSILTDNVTDRYFVISTSSSTNPKSTKHEVICKSYESEDTKWSGDAVQGIVLTEGFDQIVLDEIKNRVTNEAFASWDYTPAEPRNTGKRSALAYKIHKGEEELPLQKFSFLNFSVEQTTERIIPAEKKADMVRMWKGKKQGKARLDGGFFSSSGLILENLDKEFHCLNWSLEQLLDTYPGGRFYRGIDPGLDHPTSCAWLYLTTTNVWFVIKFYSKRGTTISERVKDIIRLSNNEREKIVRSNQVFYREVHTNPNSMLVVASPTDFHTFKTDEVSGLNYAHLYANEGLVISESVHMGPEDRAVKLNSLLDKNAYPYLPHPDRKVPPGSKVYFLIQEPGVAEAVEKFDNLFWDRYKAGDFRGEPKDKVPIHGDDELDALCNVVCGPYVWTNYQPRPRIPKDSEPEFATLQLQERRKEPEKPLSSRYQGMPPEETAQKQREFLEVLQGSTAKFG